MKSYTTIGRDQVTHRNPHHRNMRRTPRRSLVMRL